MLARKDTLLLLTSLIPLLGFTSKPPSLTLIIYTIFVGYYFWKRRHPAYLVAKYSVARSIFSAGFYALIFTETLAWLDNYLIDFANQGALFHNSYIVDIVIGTGYYLGLTIAWYLLIRRYHFSLMEAFLTYGILGSVLEQKGLAVVQAVGLLFVNPLGALFVMGYVLMVHGSIIGIIHLGIRHLATGQDNRKIKYIVALPVMLVGVVVGTVLSWAIAQLI